MAWLAVETKIFLLYKIEYGAYTRIDGEPSGTPIEEYIQAQGRFRSLTSVQIADFNQEVERKWRHLKYLVREKNR